MQYVRGAKGSTEERVVSEMLASHAGLKAKLCDALGTSHLERTLRAWATLRGVEAAREAMIECFEGPTRPARSTHLVPTVLAGKIAAAKANRASMLPPGMTYPYWYDFNERVWVERELTWGQTYVPSNMYKTSSWDRKSMTTVFKEVLGADSHQQGKEGRLLHMAQ